MQFFDPFWVKISLFDNVFFLAVDNRINLAVCPAQEAHLSVQCSLKHSSMAAFHRFREKSITNTANPTQEGLFQNQSTQW